MVHLACLCQGYLRATYLVQLDRPAVAVVSLYVSHWAWFIQQ